MTDTITLPRTTVQRALEALAFSCPAPHLMSKHDAAETALRAALAQEEQAEKAPHTVVKLPPLPEPDWNERVYGGHGNEITLRWFTDHQMREYARQAVCESEDAWQSRLTTPPRREQEQEPVGWLESPYGAFRANPLYRMTAPQALAWNIPLYPHLPRREQGQEPVAFADQISFDQAMAAGKGHDVWPKADDYEVRTGRKLRALFTHPPRREWKGLTEEEMKSTCADTWSYDPYVIARAIEAALKERNHG